MPSSTAASACARHSRTMLVHASTPWMTPHPGTIPALRAVAPAASPCIAGGTGGASSSMGLQRRASLERAMVQVLSPRELAQCGGRLFSQIHGSRDTGRQHRRQRLDTPALWSQPWSRVLGAQAVQCTGSRVPQSNREPPGAQPARRRARTPLALSWSWVCWRPLTSQSHTLCRLQLTYLVDCHAA